MERLFADFIDTFRNEIFLTVVNVLGATMPVWMPVLLFLIFYHLWMRMVRMQRFLDVDHVLVEIKLPVEVTQTPLAMETVLNSMYHTGEPANPFEKYWQGRRRPQFSLEIASFEGRVHFFIWMRRKLRNIVEAQLYSHYPTIEIYEVPDYANILQYDEKTMNLFGVEQKLQKPDPFPIKTYPFFGLDKEEKEERKTDPLSGVLEFLGSFGKGQYCWLQIVIRSHIPDKRKPGTLFQKVDWKHQAEQEVEKILAKLRPLPDVAPRFMTEEEQNVIKTLQMNVGKKPFDTGIRTIYFAATDNFDSDKNAGIPTMFRQFESHAFNGFKPIFPTNFNYPWQDPFGRRSREAKRLLYNAYRWRSFFDPPYERSHFVLSSEELATVFHFPGRVVQAPTIERITSKRSEAPANLPL